MPMSLTASREDERPNVAPASSTPTPRTDSPAQWSSDELLAGRAEISILHGDSVYRLRLTALGKLILTK